MTPSGLSKPRLSRLRDAMSRSIERRDVPGVVTLIARRGELHVETLGTMSLTGRALMARETIFRIASMTKPITAVAAMILVEECKLRLDDPVAPLLPELQSPRVLRSVDGPIDDTEPLERPITLRDLLTFRAGFGMLPGPPSRPIQRMAAEQGIHLGLPKVETTLGPDEWMARLGTLPLMAQPGARWIYHTGSDILGVLIARASGKSFEEFLRERIFEPLGMRDTSFQVPGEKVPRFATAYLANQPAGGLALYDEAAGGQWTRAPSFPAGASGLVSTVDDYLSFGLMMKNKGMAKNVRILSRHTVDVMIEDQLTDAQKAISGFVPGYWDARGWGFGVSMVTKRDDSAANPGRFGWDGAFGTSWCSDPKEDLVAILMTQRGASPVGNPFLSDFWSLVYQAIDD